MDRQDARAARFVKPAGDAPLQVIPEDRLPPGFAAGLDRPPVEGAAAVARPAATVVLMRAGDGGLEIFLLRRNRDSGFVPGAWVFPGGRVDPGDADPLLAARVADLPPEPEPASWFAAVRETFEETGILLAHYHDATPHADACALWREELLEDRATLGSVLASLRARADVSDMVYFAHWITPLAERRRFDTRFFAVATPAGVHAVADAREMSDARWVAPAKALQLFEAGALPMVFPTVHTLRRLAQFSTVSEALSALRARPVRTILPRLVRTDGGVGIVIDQEE